MQLCELKPYLTLLQLLSMASESSNEKEHHTCKVLQNTDIEVLGDLSKAKDGELMVTVWTPGRSEAEQGAWQN